VLRAERANALRNSLSVDKVDAKEGIMRTGRRRGAVNDGDPEAILDETLGDGAPYAPRTARDNRVVGHRSHTPSRGDIAAVHGPGRAAHLLAGIGTEE
jgi:hypothetical protein